MKRRDFLKKAGIGAAAAAAGITGLVACAKEEEKPKEAAAPAVVTKKTTKWKMTSTWPPKLPVLQSAAPAPPITGPAKSLPASGLQPCLSA